MLMQLMHSIRCSPIDPEFGEAFYYKGIALAKDKKIAEAAAAFEQANRLMPDFTDAYLQKGRALAALGIYHEAADAFKQVLVSNPDDLTALYGQARAFDHQGLYEDAIAAYTHINQIDPACERVFYYKGIALVCTTSLS